MSTRSSTRPEVEWTSLAARSSSRMAVREPVPGQDVGLLHPAWPPSPATTSRSARTGVGAPAIASARSPCSAAGESASRRARSTPSSVRCAPSFVRRWTVRASSRRKSGCPADSRATMSARSPARVAADALSSSRASARAAAPSRLRSGRWCSRDSGPKRRASLSSALRAQRRDDQQARRVRPAQELGQQRERVGVGPLQVVDDGHDGPLLTEAAQELAQGREHRGPHLARVHALGHVRGVRERVDPSEHGERVQQDGRARRQQGLDEGRVALAQDARQRVDDPVDGLERHGLALVAAPREPERRRALRLEERPHEGRFADAGLAAHDERPRAAARADLGQRRLERRQLERAPDEVRAAVLGRRAGRVAVGRTRRGPARREAGQHVRGAQPRRGRAREEAVAERRQISGRLGVDLPDGRRLLARLAVHDLVPRTLERQPPREQLEHDRPESVPIGGGAHGLLEDLLGRHVLGRAGPRERRFTRAARREAKVEQHGPPLRRHEDVRGLDVAVDAPRGVQRRQRLGEGPDRRAQARLVIDERRRVRAARLRPARHRGGPGRRDRTYRRGRLPHVLAADVAREVDALDELHREEPLRPFDDELAEAHEVRVVNVGDRAELVLEVRQRVGAHEGQELEGDGRAVRLIEGFVDEPHASLAKEAHQPKSRRPAERDRPQLHLSMLLSLLRLRVKEAPGRAHGVTAFISSAARRRPPSASRP